MKKKIGLVHGVFDVIHFGHIKYFEEAKSKVKKLIVSVTADGFANKGPGKPIFPLSKRMEVLRSIKWIDEVIESNYPTAIQNIKKIKPDYYIKGKDYKNIKKDLSKNIILEKKEVEKYGGKIIFTSTELLSSSEIANKEFNYLNKEFEKILKSLNKNSLIIKFKDLIKNKNKEKILVIGEPIIDIMRFIKPSGKSNKNNTISTQFLKQESHAGGALLPIKLLSLFFTDISFLFFGNQKERERISKMVGNKIKIINFNDKNKIIKKIRYIDEYRLNSLFQNNLNEEQTLNSASVKKLNKFLSTNSKKYDQIIFFNYGYLFQDNKFVKLLSTLSKKLTVNIQSNSFNFGFNLSNTITKSKIISMDEIELRLLFQNKKEPILEILKNNISHFKKFKYTLVTQGKTGAYCIFNNTIKFIPTVLNQRTDTTGCGDVFLTTFFICHVFKRFNIEESLILSHLCAGIHANNLGNRYNLSIDKIDRILNSVLK